MIVKTIKYAILSAALVASAAIMATSAPQTHAARAARFGCYPSPCVRYTPTLTTYGEYGTVFITGAHWTPNWNIEVYVFLPVSAGGGVTTFATFTDQYGNINTSWLAPSGCFYQQVEVQAYDSMLNQWETSYAVPGCIG